MLTLLIVSFALILIFPNLFLLNILGISTGPTKTSYSIAIYGDSMVDTMGEQLEHLQTSLKKRYPNIIFHYYNYGIGSQNAEEGLKRFHQAFDYKTRHFPAISSLKPDIIIIGSFAYNPPFPYDRDKHWNGLKELLKLAKNTEADVYMLAEIAPLKSGFGKGPNGVNWPEPQAKEHSQHITELLENAVYIAQDHLKIPLINVYFQTAIDGKFGNKNYVNPSDGIHPSVAGHQLMAEMIAAKIKLR